MDVTDYADRADYRSSKRKAVLEASATDNLEMLGRLTTMGLPESAKPLWAAAASQVLFVVRRWGVPTASVVVVRRPR